MTIAELYKTIDYEQAVTVIHFHTDEILYEGDIQDIPEDGLHWIVKELYIKSNRIILYVW